MSELELKNTDSEIDESTNHESTIIDNRILWVRDRVLKCLGLKDNYKLFDDLISQNNRYYEGKLLNFLHLDTYGVTDLDRKIISFYKTYRNETIQEEISVWEESHRAKISAISAFTSKIRSYRLTKSAPGKVEKTEGEVAKLKKMKKIKKNKGKLNDELNGVMMGNSLTAVQSIASTIESDDSETAESGDNHKPGTPESNVAKLQTKSASLYDSLTFVPPPGEEHKYVLTKKIVDKVVKVPALHIICGKLDSKVVDLKNVNVVYFLRTNAKGLPEMNLESQINDEMIKHLSFGTINGHCLTNLNRMLIQVFRPLLERHFQEPQSPQSREIEKLQRLHSENEDQSGFVKSSNCIRKRLMTKTNEVNGQYTNICDEENENIARCKVNSAQINTMESKSDISDAESKRSDTSMGPFQKDLVYCLNKLISSAERKEENIENSIMSNLLAIPELSNPEVTEKMILEDKTMIQQLEEATVSIKKQFEKLLKSYKSKVIQSKDPIVEYNYWHDRMTDLSTLYEQLQYDTMKKVLLILEQADSQLSKDFKELEKTILKCFTHAKENRHFLYTLLPEFQLIESSKSFDEINKLLPPIMEELRIVWVLSKYYCREEKMISLMQKISWQLCQNVRANLSVKILIGNDLSDLINKTSSAREMMVQWKTSYLNTRKDIEICGRGTRWEFEQNLLFRETEYIIKVCSDLYQMADIAQDFYNIFSDDLKSVIKIRSLVDLMLESVDKLITPIRETDIDIFTEYNRESWEALTKVFNTESENLDCKSLFYIDRCFSELTDSREALKILLKIQKVKTREVLENKLLVKFDSIMQKFIEEIDEVELVFNENKNNPPLLKHHPQAAGSIYWKTELLNSLKNKILFYSNVKELENNTTKIIAFDKYLSLAKCMNKYEEEIYNDWLKNAEMIAINSMKKSILELEQHDRDDIVQELLKFQRESISTMSKESEKNISKKNSRASDVAFKAQQYEIRIRLNKSNRKFLNEIKFVRSCKKQSKLIVNKTLTFLEQNLRFQVNFDYSVIETIHEVEVMNNIGYKLPTLLINLCRQEDRLCDDIKAVEYLVSRYINIIDKLDANKTYLLKKHLKNIETLILPGKTRLNWNCVGIQDYCNECDHALKDLNSIIGQMDLMIRNINSSIIDEIASFNLFMSIKISFNQQDLENCMIFFDNIENKRNKLLHTMLTKYEFLSPLLLKLEELVEGTANGESAAMLLFYQYYEREILKSLLKCIQQNLEYFSKTMSTNTPIFQINAVLKESNVCLLPSLTDVHARILLNVRHLLYGMKTFPKWQKGTCIRYPENLLETIDERTFNFFEDIISDETVSNLICEIKSNVSNLEEECWKYLSKWKPYSNLWSEGKEQLCENFLSNNLTLQEYDEKLSIYGNIINEIAEAPSYIDVRSIRINLKPLTKEIKFHCKKWMQLLGEHLLKNTMQSMSDLQIKIDKYSAELQLTISSLDDFRHIMRTINNIKNITIQTEVQYDLYQKTFRTLRAHDVEFLKDQENIALNLEQNWKSLYSNTLLKLNSLKTTKEMYCKIIQNDIKEFINELNQFAEDFKINGPENVKENLDLGLSKKEKYEKMFEQKEQKRILLESDEILFNITPTDYSIFLNVKQEFENLKLILNMYESLKSVQENWCTILWTHCIPQNLLNEIQQFIIKFYDLPEDIKKFNIASELIKSIKRIEKIIKLFFELKKKAVRDRHWKKLMGETGQIFDMTSNSFSLKNIFDMDLATHENLAKNVLLIANKELEIENDLIRLEHLWNNTVFDIRFDNEQGHILNSTKYLNIILEDNLLKMQNLLVSPFVGPFLSSVRHSINTMKVIIEILEIWVEVQFKWLKLEAVITKGVFPKIPILLIENFEEISNTYKIIMTNTAEHSNVLECCIVDGRHKKLVELMSNLEQCEKVLFDYLEDIRNVFPRFYFFTDDELMEALGNNARKKNVNKFVEKVFSKVQIMFDQDDTNQTVASALKSIEGEKLDLINRVVVEEKIECWLGSVLCEMKNSYRNLIKESLHNYVQIQESSVPQMSTFQRTIINIANRLQWTAKVENMFQKINKGEKDAMQMYLQELNTSLDESTACIRTNTFSYNERQKLDVLITINVHFRDTVEMLIKNGTTDAESFEWQKQIRFYWIPDVEQIEIHQCKSIFQYGYEYKGLSQKLVITPLTERLYLSLLHVLTMNLTGILTGPAETGKTETIKDLAETFGYLCVMFSCGKDTNHKFLSKSLQGIIQSGVWSCFDELNRIELLDLSAISVQLKSIQSIAKMQSKSVQLEGHNIAVNPSFGIFATMNPTCYKQNNLLDSVKNVFRLISCLTPDIEQICEIKFFSIGFLDSKELARKLIVFHKTAQVYLSKQKHYSFGLNAINKIVKVANKMKYLNHKLTNKAILMGSIRDVHFPKLVEGDVPLFFGLLKDLFPSIYCPKTDYPEFKEVATNILIESGYTIIPEQIEKVVQLYEITRVNKFVTIAGPTSSGKSVIIDTFCRTQTCLSIPTKLHVLNPKAYSVNHLFGFYNLSTKEWDDGLFNNIFRKINMYSESENEVTHYILFDGDVDAIWIENLNSVMDDNRILILASQERIPLRKHCNFIFEVGRLQHSSPAAISRTNMVYVDSQNLGYQPYLNKWINCRADLDKELLTKMVEKYVDTGLSFIKGRLNLKKVKPLDLYISLTDLNMVIQLSYVMDALLPKETEIIINKEIIQSSNDENKKILEAIFIQACYYSLGASLVDESKQKFDEFMKNISGLPKFNDSQENLATIGYIPTFYSTLYEYDFDMSSKFWVPWKQKVPAYVHDNEKHFYEILVPTMETVKTCWFLNLMNKVHRPTILIGETASSKSATVKEFLQNLDNEKFNKLSLNFSMQTTSIHLQKSIESSVERKTLNIYGPAAGKRLIVFIDDINMPFVDIYGSQQPIALLKLMIERGGLYNLENNYNWKKMTDISYVAAMTSTVEKEPCIDPRFVSQCSVYNVTFPNVETINLIYSNILSGHLKTFNENIQQIAETIVQITLDLFKIIVERLLPVPMRFHFLFNLHDLSKIFAGIFQSPSIICQTQQQFIRLWRNEFSRIICDRINIAEDLHFVQEKIEETIKNKWIEHSDLVRFSLREPLLFGDFRNVGSKQKLSRFYEDLLDYEAVHWLFEEILEIYNSKTENGKINMILFNDALQHLTRVHRILRLHRGHILVVGMNGTGKRSVINLASFTAECEIFEVPINYDKSSFYKDIKHLYKILGVDNKKVVFLLTHFANEDVLDIVHNMIKFGMVPDLFTDKEKDIIINSCRAASEKAGCGTNQEQVWSYFIQTSVANLHVALSLNAADKNLHKYCRHYPSLINNTTINWMLPWPMESLVSTAEVIMRDDTIVPVCFRVKIVDHFIDVYNSMNSYTSKLFKLYDRKIHVYPKLYIDSIRMYLSILYDKKSQIDSQMNNFTGGLNKIAGFVTTLKQLRTSLKDHNDKINTLTENCKILVKFIQERQETYMDMKSLCVEKKKEFDTKSEIYDVEQSKIKEAQSEARTRLSIAKENIGNVTETDIAEIRSYETPPESVQIISECIVILHGADDFSWNGLKETMGDANFLTFLQEMNCDLITKKKQMNIKERLEKLTDIEQIQRTSKTAHELYKFLLSIIDYCAVYKQMKTRTNKLKALHTEKENLKKSLNEAETNLKRIEIELSETNIQYTTVLEERQNLDKEVEYLQKRIVIFDRLINNLSSENLRWQNESKVLEIILKNLFGNILLCACFLVYSGPFTCEFRNEMMYGNWEKSVIEKEIPICQPFRIESQFSNEVELSRWFYLGLSTDELSIQNAILLSNTEKIPLCIDPQQQALNWIQKVENENLKICSLNDIDFREQLKCAIINGFSLVVQDIDLINPVLNCLFTRNINKETNEIFKIDEEEIFYNSNFRLYLLTKMSKFKFDPSIFFKSIIIDYTITQNKLEEELLTIVTKHERPDLEDLKESILLETYEYQILLQELEYELVQQVVMIEDSELDHTDVIPTLNNTKGSAEEVMTKLRVAETMFVDVNELRNNYRLLAERGSILFFILLNMSLVNSMYQFCLSSYLEIFMNSLSNALADENLSSHLKNIMHILTEHVYNYGYLSFFNQDKLLFSFEMCTKIEEISQSQINFFIHGNTTNDEINISEEMNWLPTSSWKNILKLTNDFPNKFSNLYHHVLDNKDEWIKWLELNDYKSKFPLEYSETLTPFERLLLLRCFRIDRVYCGVMNYITNVMGEQYTNYPDITIDGIYNLSISIQPLILILNSGANPISDICRLGDKYAKNKIQRLSIGRIKDKEVIELLKVVTTNGQWLIIENCHLSIFIVKQIEKEMARIEKPHPEHRLWLITNPSSEFPCQILQKSLKVVIEPPSGLKLKMRNIYSEMQPEVLENCDHPAYKHLIYVTAFYHSVLQERTKFGKMGWNLAHDFIKADLENSITVIDNYLSNYWTNKNESVPWVDIKYLIGEVIYGGKLMDDIDHRISAVYLNEYFGDFTHQSDQLSRSEIFDFTTLAESDLQSCRNLIETFPVFNSSEVIGLPSNVDYNYYTKQTKYFCNSLTKLQLQVNECDEKFSTQTCGYIFSKSEFVNDVADSLLKKLPPEYDIIRIKKNFGLNITPITTVLFQELGQVNKLIREIRSSLNKLKKAIDGKIQLDDILEEMIFSLYQGSLPDKWAKLAPKSKKNLADWMHQFDKRIIQYSYWAGTNEPIVIWLSGLQFPENYLTALMQNDCKKHNWRLENAMISTKVTHFINEDDIEERPKQGCYVQGLYLDGGRWSIEENCLKPSHAKIMTEKLPILSVKPIEVKLQLKNIIKTPVYLTSNRKDSIADSPVFEADLPIKENLSYWILQNVCLLLNLD